RHSPPTRRSISHEGSVYPRGPHHCFTYSRFVIASQTRCLGASNSRSSTIVVSVGSVTFSWFVLAAIALPPLLLELFPLELLENVTQLLVALSQMAREALEPVVHFLQRGRVD